MTISNLEVLGGRALAAVSGGVSRNDDPAVVRERYKNMCLVPTPEEARRQYDEMVKHMGAGVWPRTIRAVGELCGWPVPEGARRTK